ncbi:MAG: helix-hairpin-helix domain-containing protein [Acidobacteria bacterium]|nr:helix-hairpin-helix domain-containing protein [Acidobacteriota bacterium]
MNAVKVVFSQTFGHRTRRPLMGQMRFFPLMLFCYALLAFAGVSSCVKLPRRAGVVSGLPTSGLTPTRSPAPNTLININTASREELEKLPGIGEGLAVRIIEHRGRYGAFRRAEHLIMVRGISERRFDELRAFVTVD